MHRDLIKILTPFIISLVDIVNGVILYLKIEYNFEINGKILSASSHVFGSSVLLIAYILVRSPHMCKYYKASCYSLLMFHLYAILYIFTSISFLWYMYVSWVILSVSLICWIVYILGARTRRLIRQSYRRE